MTEETKRQLDRDEQIYQLTTLVAGEFSLQEVLDKLAEAAVKITGVKACSIRLLDEDSGDLKMRSTYGLSEEYRNKGVVNKEDPVILEAFAGKAVVLNNMSSDPRVKFPEATVKEGLVSQLTVAMRFRKQPIGVLRLYSPKPKHFNKGDINIARAVASQCAAAITNAKLYREAIEGARIAEQMRLAGVIQRRMIPEKAPSIPGLEIAATYIPCFDVGGDLYDFFQVSDECITVAIADVIGKGIPAAIMMSGFRGAVRAYAETQGSTKDAMRKIIANLNRVACGECRDGEFISLFYSVIDFKNMTMTYCNCGHEPTVLLRNGDVTMLNKGGLVLGVEAEASHEIETIELKEGDLLLFYTDGLIDAANFDGDLWGQERMIEAAKKCAARGESADAALNNILGYRRRFAGLARQVDDTSIIAIKVGKVSG